MAKFQYDKKQLLPATAMGLASAGLFGYFFLKISTPPPIQAAAPPAKNATAAAVSPSAGSTSQAGTQTADSLNTDQAIALPLPSSRDPFAAAIVDNGSGAMPVRVARNIPEPNDRTPIVPGLPSPGSLGPMRPVTPPMGQSPIVVKPAGPDWVVTGVLSEPSDPRNRMAILRSSSERRFVRLGDMVDGSFRLTDVERYGVTLTDGNQHYKLMLGGTPKVPSGPSPVSSATRSIQSQPSPGAGIMAPDFTVQDSFGRALKLSSFRGKVVVIDFWATWCGPCQESLPGTNAVAREFADKNVVVLAINVWDTPDAFHAWLPQHSDLSSLTFGIDPAKGGTDIATQLYQVHAIPTQFVIDRSGKLVARLVGYGGSENALVNAIQSAENA